MGSRRPAEPEFLMAHGAHGPDYFRGECRPAGSSGDGAPCGTDRDCESGLLLCVPGGGSDFSVGKCRPPGSGQLGDPCDVTAHCSPGLVCNRGYNAPDTVPAYVLPGNLGDPCLGENENCAGDLVCVDKTCVEVRQVGESCNEGADCSSGLVCNYAYRPAECHAPGQAGDLFDPVCVGIRLNEIILG